MKKIIHSIPQLLGLLVGLFLIYNGNSRIRGAISTLRILEDYSSAHFANVGLLYL